MSRALTKKSNTKATAVTVLQGLKNSPVKVLMAGIGLLAGVFAVKEAIKLIKVSGEQQKLNDVDDAIKEEERKGNHLSYPLAYYNTYADQIEQATDAAGTDSSAIYRVMGAMNNNADVLQLIKAYGKRLNFAMFIPLGNFTLPQILISELSESELAELNRILSSKAINIQF